MKLNELSKETRDRVKIKLHVAKMMDKDHYMWCDDCDVDNAPHSDMNCLVCEAKREIEGTVKIDTFKDRVGYFTQRGDFYYCPECDSDKIMKGFSYCPECGVKLRFIEGHDPNDDVELNKVKA